MTRYAEPVSRFRSASLLLGLINVYQPVSRAMLLQQLGGERKQELSEALRFLVSQGLVKALPNDQYRTTWAGQRSLSSRVLGQKRDVRRMWHLANLSDNYRRNEEGEGFSE